MSSTTQHQAGMTMIELVIAIAITAVVGLISAQLLTSMLTNDTLITEHQTDSARLDRALRLLNADLETLIPNRPLVNPQESSIPGLILEFSHLDTQPINGGEISQQERVRYLLDGTRLFRYSSAVPATVDEDHWSETLLLDQVESIELAYWQDNRWSDTPSETAPKGIRISIQSSQWDTVELITLLDFDGGES